MYGGRVREGSEGQSHKEEERKGGTETGKEEPGALSYG